MIILSQTKLTRSAFEKSSPLFVSLRRCNRLHYSGFCVQFNSYTPVLEYYDQCIAAYWRHGELLFVPENYFVTNELFDWINLVEASWNGVKIIDQQSDGGVLNLENSVVWVNALSVHLEDFSFQDLKLQPSL
jgi:hypothetical protein